MSAAGRCVVTTLSRPAMTDITINDVKSKTVTKMLVTAILDGNEAAGEDDVDDCHMFLVLCMTA